MIRIVEKALSRFVEAMLRPISKGVTLFVAAYTVLWGFWVFNPWWSVFSTANLYSGLNEVAPEWFWGLVAIGCGAASIISTIDERYPRTAFTAAAITGWFWLAIGILYLYGDWHNTGGITGVFLSLLCAYIFLNVRANGGYRH